MRGAIRWRLPLQLTALPALRPSGVASVIAPLLAKQDVLRTFFAFSLINLSSWAGIQRILFTFVFANFHFLHFRSLRLLRNFTADICFVGVLTFSFFRSTAI